MGRYREARKREICDLRTGSGLGCRKCEFNNECHPKEGRNEVRMQRNRFSEYQMQVMSDIHLTPAEIWIKLNAELTMHQIYAYRYRNHITYAGKETE